METTKLFNQIIDKFPAVAYLQIWNDVDDFKLIGWQNKHIYISSLTKDHLQNPMVSLKTPSCYEELISPEDIVEVFYYENKYYAVDRQCHLSEMVREVYHDADWEGDLFDETPKKLLKSHLKRKYKICNDAILLAACIVKHEMAFLINTSTSIVIKVINPSTFTETKCFTVRNSSLTLSLDQICLMLFVPQEKIEVSYIKNWFPEVQLECFESGLLIVSLPECIIFGVLLDEIPLTPHFLFSWPFQAVQAQWFCLENKEPNRIHRKSNLILVFDGGTVVILDQYGGKTVYMPLNKITRAYISPEHVIVTDNSECYTSKYHENEEIACLSIKGILGFCKIPEKKNIILAITKHRTLYAINLNVNMKRDEFKLPKMEIFDDFLRKTKYLEQLSKELEVRDNYINALSYSLGSSVMKFDFTAQVVSIAGNLHTLRIKITSENPGIIFRSTTWKLLLSLYSSDSCFTFVRNLEFDFTIDTPYIDFITIEFKGNYWDFDFNAKLVCYIGKDKYRPSVNIGSVLIDISHFIQPIDSLKLYESQIEKDVKIDEVLEYMFSKSNNQIQNVDRKRNEETIPLLSFKVPVNEALSNETIVKKLLSNCRALWRAAEWNDTCKKENFEIFIAGNIIKIELNESALTISGRNVESCHSLKLAALKLVNEKLNINIDANAISKIDDLLQSLDLLQYTNAHNVEQQRIQTLKLYKQLKEEIMLPLTGIKTHFISESLEYKSSLEED